MKSIITGPIYQNDENETYKKQIQSAIDRIEQDNEIIGFEYKLNKDYDGYFRYYIEVEYLENKEKKGK